MKKKMPWHNKRSSRAETETPNSARSRSPRPHAYSKGSDSPKIGVPDKPDKTQNSHPSAPISGSSAPRSAKQLNASGSAFFVPPPLPSTETDSKPADSKPADPKPAESQPVDDEVIGFFFDPPIQPSAQPQLPITPLQPAVKAPTPNGVSNDQSSTPVPLPGKKRFNWVTDKTPEPAPAQEESSTVSGSPNSTSSTADPRSSRHKHKKQKTHKSDSVRRASALPQWAKQEVRSSQGSPARRQRGLSIRSSRSGRPTPGPSTQP